MYGIDIEDGILQRRTWRWLQNRILMLLSTESRMQRLFNPPEEPPKTRRR
ncbi:hypothetical protein OHB41_20905 [Streptomyces sp. NBC_01571]|nr:hypothetical protein [Streptomyces sp. NBC_01571]MCX4575603.1 hypothetical protein [Streptomyces sp. NBC_01571]